MIDIFDYMDPNIVNWYLSLPLPAQIAVIVGGIAVAILAVILAVYIIKLTILAIVYLIKGMIKAIKWGVKQIKDAAKAPCCAPANAQEKDPFAKQVPVANPATIKAKTPDEGIPRFCAQCGAPLDANIRTRLGSGQSAFCSQCGTSLSGDVPHEPASVQA